MGKLSMRDFVCPGTRVGPTEDLKIGFNFLVDMFSFTIRLEVVHCGKGEVVGEKLAKFFGKGGGKLWTMIRDDFVIESKV